jgi:prepilin-type N-terminal cleavage/methylation domain-containing protein
MNRNGFTFVEMLIAIVVLCTIIVIVVPMRVVRARKLDQAYAKAQLMTIKDSQDRYKMEHGMYTTDITKLANWKTGTKKYRFRIEYANRSRFTAQANGDMDNDKVYDDDIWAIDQSGTLTKIK